ncbi:ATP-grasp domain-containing protein [Streptomyces sp. NPDC003863]
MSTIVILGGAAPVGAGHGRDLSLRALRQFKARGSRVVVTDTGEALAAAPEYAFLADETHVVDYTDPDSCVTWALEYRRRHAVDAVTGFREYSVVAVAEVAAALGLAGNLPELVRMVRTKDACRRTLRDLGFRQPASALRSTVEDIEDFLALHGGPAVVKPRDAAGSEGVVRIDTPREAADALAVAGRGGDRGLVLVEEFVEGPEFSVEGIFAGGSPYALAVTRKLLAPGTFVEAGHTTPVELPGRRHEEIAHEATRALKALGLTHGVFHVECRLTDRGPVLGEVHVRPGGDRLHAMVEWAHPALELFGSLHDDLLGFGCFAAAFACLGVERSAVGLFTGVVLVTFAEMLLMPSLDVLVGAAGPPERHAVHFSLAAIATGPEEGAGSFTGVRLANAPGVGPAWLYAATATATGLGVAIAASSRLLRSRAAKPE